MTEANSSWHVWTSREVEFTPFPTEPFDDDAVLDALCAHYWSRPAWLRRFVEPTISGGSGLGFAVTGLPWWMPGWWALRTVAAIMACEEVGGIATIRLVRTTLQA